MCEKVQQWEWRDWVWLPAICSAVLSWNDVCYCCLLPLVYYITKLTSTPTHHYDTLMSSNEYLLFISLAAQWGGSGLCGLAVERLLVIQKVEDSNLVRSASRWQPCASCWHACASVTKQHNLVPAKRQWRSLAGKVTAGMVESNGSLPPGGWLQVTCGLTACTPGWPSGPMLGNEYGEYFTLFLQWSGSKIQTYFSDMLLI